MRALLLIVLLTGCAMQPQNRPQPFAELSLRTNIQPWMDWMLKEERSWMGQNLYLDGEFGLEWNHGVKCPVLETGTSLLTGAPFDRGQPPELHWAYLRCGMKWGGKK